MITVDPRLPAVPTGKMTDDEWRKWAEQLTRRLSDVLRDHAREINEKPTSIYEDPAAMMEL